MHKQYLEDVRPFDLDAVDNQVTLSACCDQPVSAVVDRDVFVMLNGDRDEANEVD